MVRRRLLARVFAAVAVVGYVPAASAENCTGDARFCAAKDFERGRRLAQAGNCEAAIPFFQKSLHRAANVGHQLSLGECYAKVGMFVEAYDETVLACQRAASAGDPRESVCRLDAARLETKVLRIRLLVPDPAAITIDGAPLSATATVAILAGTYAVSAAGTHCISVKAAGGVEFTREIQGAAGTIVDIRSDTATPEVDSPPEATPPAVPDAASPPPSVPPTPSVRVEVGSAQVPYYDERVDVRRIGIIFGGVGVVGLGLGAYLGVRTLDDKASADRACPGGADCTPYGHSLGDRAKIEAWASDASFGVGILAGAVATLLIVKSLHIRPAGTLRVAPTLSRSDGGIRLQGAW